MNVLLAKEGKSTEDISIRLPTDCSILVVDDVARTVELFAAILKDEGYHQILSAETGHEALKIIAEKRPDVVVLDVLLPDVDGIEVCRRIKDNPDTHFLPIILVTGLDEKKLRVKGIAAGADDFLGKPVDALELVTRVRASLRSKLLHDELEAHRRDLEERVEERTAELKTANMRMRDLIRVKSNVLTLVSHELRTPLGHVKSAVEMLAGDDIPAPRREELLGMASAALIKLEYRINDMSALSDPADLSLRRASVGDLVDRAAEQVRTVRGRERTVIEVDVPGDLPAVRVDPEPMLRALAHVIDNAVKFGKGKPVQVCAQHVKDRVQIEIKDQGPGIPATLRPHLFRPFEVGDSRSTRSHDGLGIGLALVKVILDAHQAVINIESQGETGTTVTILLPPDTASS